MSESGESQDGVTGIAFRVRQTIQRRHKHHQQQHRCGFTLVELLVVISIIALLISILLPSLKQAREQAKTVKCLAHSRGMGQAGMTFAGDHNGLMQLATVEGDSQIGRISVDPSRQTYEYASNDEILSWPAALARAMDMTIRNNWDWGVRANSIQDAFNIKDKIPDGFDIFKCPADKVELSTPFYPRSNGLIGQGGDPPLAASDATAYWGYLSYGINEDIMGTEVRIRSGIPWPAVWKNGKWGESTVSGWNEAGLRLKGNLDKVYDPATVLLIVDAGPNSIQEAQAGEFTVDNPTGAGYANLVTTAKARGPFLERVVDQWEERIPTKRHPKGAINVTFADLHSERVNVVGWRPGNVRDKIPAKFGDQVRVSPYAPFER